MLWIGGGAEVDAKLALLCLLPATEEFLLPSAIANPSKLASNPLLPPPNPQCSLILPSQHTFSSA